MVKAHTMETILNSQMPLRIRKAKDLLCLDDDDDIIKIMRYYNWNQQKVEEKWFEDSETL